MDGRESITAEATPKAAAGEGCENLAPEKSRRLGVLLVHGVGSERRGDSLVHCATAIHKWVKTWALNASLVDPNLAVDLVDTSIVQASADSPAHARLVIRQGETFAPVSWLITESCWFDAYRRPGFFDFLSWATLVLPIAVILHFLAVHERVFSDFKLCEDVLQKRPVDPEALARLKKAAAPEMDDPTTSDAVFRKRLRQLYRARGRRLYSLLVEFTLTALLAMVAEVVLVAIAALAIIPGYPRDFAGWVQRKLTGTIGDSFLFVSSPITEAAVTTRVKADLDWLRSKCDDVVILAHSQGAAVSYTMLNRESWGGARLDKVALLITYGSGLRKLVDLRHAQRDRAEQWMMFSLFSALVAVGMLALAALCAAKLVPLPVLFFGTVLGLLSHVFVMQRLGQWMPQIQDLGVKWRNFYASHDPVPFGPLGVKREGKEKRLEEWQDEVVNRMSIISDHTSYWESSDDFVAKTIQLLCEASGLVLNDELDEEWLKVSARRRRWRVEWLAKCRAATLVSVISLPFTLQFMRPDVFDAAAATLDAAAPSVGAALRATMGAIGLSEPFVVGSALLLGATLACFVSAAIAWRLWNKTEQGKFFHRHVYRLPWVWVVTFIVAWFAGILVAPAVIALNSSNGWLSILPMLVVPSILASWSLWSIIVLSKAQNIGRPTEWGLEALDRARIAEADDKQEPGIRYAAATIYYGRAKMALSVRKRGGADWEAALKGQVQAAKKLAKHIVAYEAAAADLFQKANRELQKVSKAKSHLRG